MLKLRQALEAVTSGVQEGRAQHQRQLALSRKLRPAPYSPWLSQPFLKVAALPCRACHSCVNTASPWDWQFIAFSSCINMRSGFPRVMLGMQQDMCVICPSLTVQMALVSPTRQGCAS